MKNTLKLWYEQKATNWESEALPIGNGYMGAMIFGGPSKERIQYNEKTLWSGGPGEYDEYIGGNKPGAFDALQEIRTLLSKGKEPTEDLYKKVCGNEQGFGAYQNFGDLIFEFNNINEKNIINYRREIDLETAVSKVKFLCNDVLYEREYFCNYPSNVFVFHINSSKKDNINFSIYKKSAHTNSNVTIENNTLTLKGQLENGMFYESQLKVMTNGGYIYNHHDKLTIESANSVEIIMTAGTSYINCYPHYTGENPHDSVTNRINSAHLKGYSNLKREHISDYQSLFKRVNLNISLPKIDKEIPTDKLLKEYKNNTNNQLEELFFNYGRYLLISSSREGSLPANLQGVWNNSNTPPWSSDYHFNVNLQMNYWPSEVANLSSCLIPLIDYVDSLRIPGKITSKIHCGVENGGWVVNTMNNPFGFTATGWEFDWGFAPTCNAWICQNIWQHYEFNGDKEYLKNKIYPIMKEASKFWCEFLVEYIDKDEKTYLVSSPSFSPEHGPRTIGTSYDQELIWQLFNDTIKASKALDVDEKFRKELESKKEQLLVPKIGKYGQVQEWMEDIDNPKDDHRHISHLVGLYPGNQITPLTKELFNASKITMNQRGDGGTGWSKANKINLWARLLDGNRAHKLLQEQLKHSTLTNLFDTHPPFQIDGNFGAVAGISEMLLQSHFGVIEPLPALPEKWSTGSYGGLKARGNFEVSAYWNKCSLNKLTIKSNMGNVCTIKYKNISKFKIKDTKGEIIVFNILNDETISFKTTKGNIYYIENKDFIKGNF